ncbi:hypothetical protein G7046_g9116 [Stylonectria norvegica]|nr:hypothetical protein G7046_g9116 [Stylonectria norvegica]
MRLAVRWLSFFLSAVLLLFFYLHPYFLTRALLGSTDANPPSRGPLADANIAAFWQKWSRIMYDARPNTESPISIRASAWTNPPQNADEPRKPPLDRVQSSEADIERLRMRHTQFVKELEMLDKGNDTAVFQGRGVVMVGGGEYFGPAIISIHMLRRTGCALPVEVFVPSDSEYEEEVCESYLPRLGAKCVVLSHFQVAATGEGAKAIVMEIKHYQLKPLALLLSSFAEVLLLDSDSIPLVDPEVAIFQAEPYISSGLITWPDFWAATESPRFWQIAGFSSFPENLPATSSESGQLAINKNSHLASLLLATYYNVYGPEHFYPLLSQGALGQGDKETFMAAAVALNATYHRVTRPALRLGRYDGETKKPTAIVQHLPSNGGLSVPAFLHSNTPKMNAGHLVDEGDLVAIDGKSRLRLLGPKAEAEQLFGFDMEDTLWDLLVQTGCELAGSIGEWRQRENLCERLTEHHQLVFDEHES